MIKRSVYLISCGKRKSDTPCMASDMYNSERFVQLKNLAILTKHEWYIISAKHGLLKPDTIIDPYDMCIDSFSIDQQRTWARKVVQSIGTIAIGAKIVVWADGVYSKLLRDEFDTVGIEADFPLSNLKSDDQAKYLQEVRLSKDIIRFYEILDSLINKTGGGSLSQGM